MILYESDLLIAATDKNALHLNYLRLYFLICNQSLQRRQKGPASVQLHLERKNTDFGAKPPVMLLDVIWHFINKKYVFSLTLREDVEHCCLVAFFTQNPQSCSNFISLRVSKKCR